MLGYSEGEVGDDPQEWFKRVHPEDLNRVKEALNGHLSGKEPHFAHEHRLHHKDSRYRWVFCRGLAITDPQGHAIRIAGSFTDITRHRELEQRLMLRAFYDPLTGLPNRAFFIERLSQAYLRSERHPSRSFGLFFLDLDRFKYINDHLGHQTGDLVLIEVARRIQNSIRPTDIAARMGGDEFTVLLEDLSSRKEAFVVAERILASLREPFHLNEKTTVTAASIGIAFSDCGRKGPDGILQAADAAMYRAKVLGKGTFEIFDEGPASDRGNVGTDDHGS